jgi:hypothetical protein
MLGSNHRFCFQRLQMVVSITRGLEPKQKEDERKKFDSKVFDALFDQQVPRSSRGMTGGGMLLTLASEVANYLEADQDDVEDSLQRLQMRGRIRQDDGWWVILPH